MKHLIVMACILLFTPFGHAHPQAPGLLSIIQQNDSQYLLSWKTPLRKSIDVHLLPRLPLRCQRLERGSSKTVGTGKLQSWRIDCGSQSLNGESITLEGLQSAKVGVLLQLQFLDGRHFHQMLNATNPVFLVPEKENALQVFSNYLSLGIEHLFSGIDHILFVIILVLLVGWGRKLFWTITLFTFSHSITLALSTFGYVRFPTMLIEALIALSIVIAALELIPHRQQTLIQRLPWLMSGGFGLLHGMGFAGALSKLGLPGDAIPLALAGFNTGIELGQLSIVAIFVLFIASFRKTTKSYSLEVPVFYRYIPAYSIGTAGAVWFWQRLGVFEGAGMF